MKATGVSLIGRLWRVALVASILALAQDVVTTLLAHQQFAGAEVCTDPAARTSAGRYADIHCREHLELGNAYSLSSYLAALAEIRWQRLVSVVAAVAWGGV